MDDASTFGKDLKEAVTLNCELLALYWEHGLFCNPKKCKDKIELLGVTVDEKGFGVEDKKVRDIRDWPTPKIPKELKGFIGFCNFYQRFIKGFSLIAKPLHDLDQKEKKWEWGGEQEKAFKELKEAIMAESCLAHIDDQKTFRLEQMLQTSLMGQP